MAASMADRPVSVIPERRRRPPDDVIDVDLLDDGLIQPPAQRRRLSSSLGSSSNAIVIDSDDDISVYEQPSASGSSRARPRRPGSPRSRLISPPPPIPDATIPPVPEVSARFHRRAQNRLHSRSGQRAGPAGFVRPNEEPFAFERSFRSSPATHSHHTVTPPPPVAPPSHHQPSMGFGGAILALNRQNMLEERIQRERARERRLDVLRRAMRFPYAAGARSIISRTLQSVSNRLPEFLGAGGTYDMNGEELVDAIAMSEVFDESRDDSDLFGEDEGLLGTLRRLHPEYKTIYTHPQPPAPGFTYDFAPSNSQPSAPEVISLDDDEAGPSSSAAASTSAASSSSDVSTSIVCAHCLDPLALGAMGSAVDQAQRKLWGLRCGHLLDGKCVHKLMQPAPEPQDDTDVGLEEDIDSKGNGKEKEDSPQMPGAFVGGASRISEKARGKCRADAASSDESPSDGFSLNSRFIESAEVDSMRARLRPRNGAGHVQAALSSSSTTLQDNQAASRSHPLPGVRAARSSRAAKAKGKRRVVLPQVEAEYEWCCPVPRCGKVHVSVKLEGQGWVMDESGGAIGIFV